ncbi:MAG: hypothetical protein WCA07_01540, partial [Gloeobacterales cyanobacterium]
YRGGVGVNENVRMNFINPSENERLLIWARHRAARDALSFEEEQSQEEEKNPFPLKGDKGATEPE